MTKTILVTGATSGFGRAIATLFAANGFNIIITGRREDRLSTLRQELGKFSGVAVTSLCFDVRDKVAVKQTFEELFATQQRIDILVNNAGLAAGQCSIDEGDTDDWDLMIDTNVKGLLYVTRQVIPFMKRQKSGHIFNIGSTAGKVVYKNGNVYNATKFAVDALNQSMRIDLLPYGIKVTGVNPGMAETEFSLVRFKGDQERAAKVYEGIQPLRAEDIAEVVYYCANVPPHVCINDLTLTCTYQANAIYTVREGEKIN